MFLINDFCLKYNKSKEHIIHSSFQNIYLIFLILCILTQVVIRWTEVFLLLIINWFSMLYSSWKESVNHVNNVCNKICHRNTKEDIFSSLRPKDSYLKVQMLQYFLMVDTSNRIWRSINHRVYSEHNWILNHFKLKRPFEPFEVTHGRTIKRLWGWKIINFSNFENKL